MAAVEVHGLSKRYGSIEALRGIDLTVPEGCVFGLVGPNGAGKSTLIKALVGSLRPTGGQARTLGLDPLRDRAALRRRIGYMPQSPALYNDLSARANVAFFAAAHGTPDLDRRVDEVMAFAELRARMRDPVGQFSGGMQRRVSLACALVHSPRMLFLDEPTAAVDPALRARFWQSFRTLAADGVTLFISTHLMDEALLCDLVAIQREGRIIACAPPREILARGRTHVRICDAGRDQSITIGGRPHDLAAALRPYGLRPDVSAVTVEADSLETVVLQMIQGEKEQIDA